MLSTRKLGIIVRNLLSTYFFLTRPLLSGKFILFLSENIDFFHKRGIIIFGLFIIIKHAIYI